MTEPTRDSEQAQPALSQSNEVRRDEEAAAAARDRFDNLPTDPGGHDTDIVFGPPGYEERNVVLRSGPPEGTVAGDKLLAPDGTEIVQRGETLGGEAIEEAGLQSSDDESSEVGDDSDEAEEDRLDKLEPGEPYEEDVLDPSFADGEDDPERGNLALGQSDGVRRDPNGSEEGRG